VSQGANEDVLVTALARTAVAGSAPEELPLFRAMSEAYVRDPSSLEQGEGKDELLGFGVDVALTLVTPIALSVARDVAGFVVEQLRRRAREEGEGAIERLLERLGVGDGDKVAPTEPAATPLLSRDQLAHVRTLALEKALQLKLPTAKAELLADSLAGSLATA
jgi:hypothetical protein